MGSGRPALVIVTGPPASGKTTIAREIGRFLRIPTFHKDDFKERLANTVPGSGLEWSRNLGSSAYEMLFLVGQTMVESGSSCLLEANFHPDLSIHRMERIANSARVAQVVCSGAEDVLMRRYFERHRSGGRHPVHLDLDEGRRELLRTSFRRDHVLALNGVVIRCDTTSPDPVDPKDIASCIGEELEIPIQVVDE